MLVRLDLDEFERKLDKETQELLVDLANEMVNQWRIEAPVGATGDLQNSFQIFRTGDGVVWIGTRIHYAMDVWQGRGPHLADFDAIQVWARRKLGDESAAGPVWRSIAQHGTEPNDYIGRGIDKSIDRVT